MAVVNEAKPRRTCPGCESLMQVFTAREVEIDRCPFCGGIWLDRGELEAVTQKPLVVERFDGHTTRRCVYCAVTMATALVGSVPAEVCTACLGAYLDDGELEELAGRSVKLSRTDAPVVATAGITYRCVGCGDTLTIDQALTTSRGMSCRHCYGRTDFGGPSPTFAQSGYGNRALMTAEGSVYSVDLAESLVDAALSYFWD